MMNRQFIENIKFPESLHIPIPGIRGFWYRVTNKLANQALLKASLKNYTLNKEKRDERIIASLTSYPARINYVWLAIKSIMLQSYKPDRILLWLADEQFPTHELPDNILVLQEYGLEIKWVKDIYGHKKYLVPVMEQKPDELVITFDDDIIYAPDCIERLVKKHKEYPTCLICDRGQAFEDKTQLNPGRWKVLSDIGVDKPTFSMNPSPGGGCLIPYGAFHPDATKEECFRRLAYKNDDLWYMFMCAANGTRIIKTQKYHRVFSVIDGTQTEQMATENIIGDRNTEIMKGLITAYPEAWKRITTDEL